MQAAVFVGWQRNFLFADPRLVGVMGNKAIYQRRISIWMIMYECIINRSAIISAIPYAEPNNVAHNIGWLAMDWHTLFPNTGLNIPQSDPL